MENTRAGDMGIVKEEGERDRAIANNNIKIIIHDLYWHINNNMLLSVCVC